MMRNKRVLAIAHVLIVTLSFLIYSFFQFDKHYYIPLILISLLCALSITNIYWSLGFFKRNDNKLGLFVALSSFMLYLAALLLYEWILFDIRDDKYSRLMPELMFEYAPVLIAIAYSDLFSIKTQSKHSLISLLAFFALAIAIVINAISYAFSFSCIYLSITHRGAYSWLSILYAAAIVVCGFLIIFTSKNKKSVYYLIGFSMILKALISFIELSFGYYSTPLTIAVIGKNIAISLFTSFSLAILFALSFVYKAISNIKPKSENSSKPAITIRKTEDGYEIPPNLPL